jgi:hypothetical protein
MATLKIQAPDGKTLRISVPEGTNPAEYDKIVDDVITDYSGKSVSTEKAPVLDTGLRAMTGSMNPTPPIMLPKEAQVPYTTGEEAGWNLAGKAVESGANPYLAGTAALIPTIAKEVMVGEAVGAPLGRGVSKLTKLLKKVPSSTGSSEVIAENIRNLPLRQADEATKLEALRKSYGSNIETARAKAGIPQGKMSELPMPKDVIEFADEMKVFSQRNADDLVRDFGKEGLADLKDTIQVMRESGKIPYGSRMSAEVNKAASKIDEALAKVSPELEESLQGYRLTKQQAEDLPKFYKERTIEARNQLARAKASEKASRGREFVKKAFKGVLPWVGGGAVAKFF